jgi:mono/diheme cytochrome c family protein
MATAGGFVHGSRWGVGRRLLFASVVSAIVLVISIAASRAQEPSGAGPDGWTIPPEAANEKNPVSMTPQVLAAGRALFQKNCRLCHVPKGVGDGPDADPDHMADMDLTNPKRAKDNPDGVVFYRVWNGRQKPKMPAFRDDLTREQIWAIVAYVQSLRKPPAL